MVLSTGRVLSVLPSLLGLVLVACSAGSTTGPGGDAPPGTPDGPRADGPLADGPRGDGPLADGQTASCTKHSDCGTGNYCAPSGTCAPNSLYGPCDSTPNCIGGQTCTGGHCGCGGEELVGTTAVAPNLVIALDRSQTMATNYVQGTNQTRWEVAVNATKTLTAKYQTSIRFGVVLYPRTGAACSGASCQGTYPAIADIALGLNNAENIANLLDGADTCQSTPLGATLTALESFEGLKDTTRSNYIVIMTDGLEDCSGNAPKAATELLQQSPSVKTFAVGFSNGVDATVLTNIARNGGTARTGTPEYYQADNATDLFNAFESITGSIVSCTYTLSKQPDDPARIRVYLGPTAITRDTTHANGWDYVASTNQLNFYGSACDQVKSGGVVAVSFACPVIP